MTTTDDDVTKALAGRARAAQIDVNRIVAETVPELPGMPPKPTQFFGVAVAEAEKALDRTRSRLAELRAKRAEINDEIRTLVDEEALLDRMVRVAKGGRSKE